MFMELIGPLVALYSPRQNVSLFPELGCQNTTMICRKNSIMWRKVRELAELRDSMDNDSASRVKTIHYLRCYITTSSKPKEMGSSFLLCIYIWRILKH